MQHLVRLFQTGVYLGSEYVSHGQSVLFAVTKARQFIDAPCGGNGRCGKCKVRLSPTGEEVLACRTYVNGDMDVYLPGEFDMEIAGAEDDSIGDVKNAKGPYGVAVDIGTTTVVAHLMDIGTGNRLATESGVNAQRPFGADVISRIQHSMENGHDELTRFIRIQIAGFIKELSKKTGIRMRDIEYMAIAGNTVMEHLFADLSPDGLGAAPFKPVSLFGEELPAGKDLGIAPDAKVYLAPAVASYVGGDITAGILAAGLEDTKSSFYLDIGTNGEMAMKIGDKYYCCATAAGPAFEGAEIFMGMAAVPGAINHVEWKDNAVAIETIGDVPPVGICGSGLLDALALLLNTGAVDETGRLLSRDEAEGSIKKYLETKDGKNIFWLTTDKAVCMTAEDIRKLQLAKAAIAAGIQTLIHHSGATEIESFRLAGGFGSYMNHVSAVRIGVFPKSFLPVTRVMGNMAGEGAVLATCSADAREALADICRRCEYIELSGSTYFMEEFVEQMMFEE